VLLDRSGFDTPDWSVRVSFANLDDHVEDIGRAVARSYMRAFDAARVRERTEWCGSHSRPDPKRVKLSLRARGRGAK
jgi:hypothetical protein